MTDAERELEQWLKQLDPPGLHSGQFNARILIERVRADDRAEIARMWKRDNEQRAEIERLRRFTKERAMQPCGCYLCGPCLSRIEQAERDLAEGKGVSFEEVLAELNAKVAASQDAGSGEGVNV